MRGRIEKKKYATLCVETDDEQNYRDHLTPESVFAVKGGDISARSAEKSDTINR